LCVVQEAPSGEVDERVLIRQHEYDQWVQGVQLVQRALSTTAGCTGALATSLSRSYCLVYLRGLLYRFGSKVRSSSVYVVL